MEGPTGVPIGLLWDSDTAAAPALQTQGDTRWEEHLLGEVLAMIHFSYLRTKKSLSLAELTNSCFNRYNQCVEVLNGAFITRNCLCPTITLYFGVYPSNVMDQKMIV